MEEQSSTQPPPSIYEAMAAVMADIGAVGKDDFNAGLKFNFRGIDALQNACHGAMAKHGVFMVPQVVGEPKVQEIEGRNRNIYHAMIVMQYTFYGPRGDFVQASTVGEAMDNHDKAMNKAMSAALKYALMETFMIPTEDVADSDKENPETDPPAKPVAKKAPAKKKAPTKKPEPELDPESQRYISEITEAFAKIEDPEKRKSVKTTFASKYAEENDGKRLDLKALKQDELEAVLASANNLVGMVLAETETTQESDSE